MSKKTNPPLASTRAEMRNLKNNSSATVDELRAFLAELKGRSPQEMLGMVAGNQLFKALVQSTVFLAVLVGVCTAVPYFMAVGEENPAEEMAEEEATPTAPIDAPDPAEPVEATVPEPNPLETLGVGEEKQAPPDVNPLDNTTGGFLEELE